MTNEGTKMVRVFDLATGIRDMEAALIKAPTGELYELALRQAETADELLAALVDLGVPAVGVPLDDPYALTEVAYKVIREHLEG